MKKIAWFTDFCFVDVDLPVISNLSSYYIIDWHVVLLGECKETIEYIQNKIEGIDSINVSYTHLKRKPWDPRVIPSYYSIIKSAKCENPNLYYIACFAAPYGAFLYKLLLPLNKCVAACHNVSTPKGANRELYAKFYTNLWLRTFSNIHVFSSNQKNVLLNTFPSKNVLLAPLALKDYGVPIPFEEHRNIHFLSFGIISEYKRIDLLIQAACLLYEMGIQNFKVIIAGKCGNWVEKYQPLIKYPELFDLRIERIPNEDVAKLFSKGDYFVMPYQDIAQSGAITVAFRYNLPVIVSNIPQFQPFVHNLKDGLVFQSESAESLSETMKIAIEGNHTLKEKLAKNQKDFVLKNFSIETIVNMYKEFFESL